MDYQKLIRIPSIQNESLVLDFQGVLFLNTFEITELFAYLVLFPFWGNTYQIQNSTDTVWYLQRVNFFSQLERIKNLIPQSIESRSHTSDRLLELQIYQHKHGFYGDYEHIQTLLQTIGVGDEKLSLIVSSLWEIVDNAFSHNLWRWSSDIGPLAILLAQKFEKKRELCFSFCDFWIGFLETLKGNYPSLDWQREAILHAIKPNITGRPQGRGGNGLDYLKKNVFNGFRGELRIRSGDTVLSVAEETSQHTPFGAGANIIFTLHY